MATLSSPIPTAPGTYTVAKTPGLPAGFLHREIERTNVQPFRAQIEHFPGGVEGWLDTFVRLGDVNLRSIVLPPIIQPDNFPSQLASRLFATNTRWARMARLLAPSLDDIPVPLTQLIQYWHDDRKLRSELNTLSLQGMLVDPARITQLALSLGFITAGTESEMVAACSDVRIIDSVKLALESTREFECGQRVRLLSKPYPEEKARYPLAQEIPPELHGTLLFIREGTTSDSLHRDHLKNRVYYPLVAAHFNSVYDLQRRSMHQSGRYDSEAVSMAELNAELMQITEDIRTGWQRSTPLQNKVELRRWMVDRLLAIQNVLDGALTAEKKQMLKRTNTALELLGEEVPSRNGPRINGANPPAVTATAISIRDGSLVRSKLIGWRDRYNREDELSILNPIFRAEKLFTEFYLKLMTKIADSQELKIRQLVGDKSLDQYALRALRLTMHGSDLALRVRPFKTFYAELTRAIDQLGSSVTNQDYPGMTEAFTYMHEVLRFQAANKSLYHLLRTLTAPAYLTEKNIRGPVSKMEQLLEFKSPFEEVTNSRFGSALAILRATTTEARTLVESFIRANQPSSLWDETPPPVKPLREALKDLDIEKRILFGLLRP